MSSMLTRFIAQNRLRIDSALAERWDFDARNYGAKNIKTQIAQAKRTATALNNALRQFSNISSEQEAAIKAASKAMTDLAQELQPLVSWAKTYKEFCEKEWELERKRELETVAQERWGDDDLALNFEAELVQELATKEGGLQFAIWLHSTGRYQNIEEDNISCCVQKLGRGETLRERLASSVLNEKGAREHKYWLGNKCKLISSWPIYEEYLRHRKDLAEKTSSLLSKISFS
jgi:hypothetical protein